MLIDPSTVVNILVKAAVLLVTRASSCIILSHSSSFLPLTAFGTAMALFTTRSRTLADPHSVLCQPPYPLLSNLLAPAHLLSKPTLRIDNLWALFRLALCRLNVLLMPTLTNPVARQTKKQHGTGELRSVSTSGNVIAIENETETETGVSGIVGSILHRPSSTPRSRRSTHHALPLLHVHTVRMGLPRVHTGSRSRLLGHLRPGHLLLQCLIMNSRDDGTTRGSMLGTIVNMNLHVISS